MTRVHEQFEQLTHIIAIKVLHMYSHFNCNKNCYAVSSFSVPILSVMKSDLGGLRLLNGRN